MPSQAAELISPSCYLAAVIIFEHSFFIWDLQQVYSTQPVETAITTYQKSLQCQVVKQAIKNAFKSIFRTNLEKTLVQTALENLLRKLY